MARLGILNLEYLISFGKVRKFQSFIHLRKNEQLQWSSGHEVHVLRSYNDMMSMMKRATQHRNGISILLL